MIPMDQETPVQTASAPLVAKEAMILMDQETQVQTAWALLVAKAV